MTTARHAVIPDPTPELTRAPRLVLAPRNERNRPPVGAYVAFAAICLIWGTTFLGIRVAIETVPTLLVPSIRFIGAGVILLIVALAVRLPFPRGKEWRNQIGSGVLMVGVGNTAIVWAEHSITSGLAAMLAAMIPLWMALLESLFGFSRLTAWKIAGLALGFGGVALLVVPEIGRPEVSLKFFLAVGAVQLSGIAWNLGTLHLKRHPSQAHPLAGAAVQMLAGGTAVLLFALLTGAWRGAAFSPRSLLAMLYLTLFGSVIGYSAYVYALARLSAGKLSSYAYVNPAVAVAVGALVAGETFTVRMFLAMSVILAGVAVIQLEKRSIATKESP